jgi:Tol biopolymer transport system component
VRVGKGRGALLALILGCAAAVAAIALAVGSAGAEAGHTRAPSYLVRLPGFAGELAAWSPDSTRIAVSEPKAITIYGTDGKVQQRLRGPGIDYFGFPCECALSWTADGTRIQFVSEEEEIGETSVIGSVAADGSGEEHRSLGIPIGSAGWAKAGWPLIYVPNSRTIEGRKGKLVGPTPDLWRLSALDAQPERLLTSTAEEWDPQFSPDDSRIIFARAQARSTSLWIANADGTDARRLVRSLLGPSAAAWSPDGSQLALATYSKKKHDRRCHLYVLDLPGGRPRQIVDEEILSLRPAWTPDGRWITFATFSGAIREIHPDGTGLRTIADFPGKEVNGLAWSPDGKFLTYGARTPPHTD